MMMVLVLSVAVLLNQLQTVGKWCYKERSFHWVRLFLCGSVLLGALLLANQYRVYRGFYVYRQEFNLKAAVADPQQLLYYSFKIPRNPSILFIYARVLQKRCDSEKELEVIQQIEKRFPTPSLWIQKGELYERLGNLSCAETAYKMAANMVPSRQKARYKLVLLYLRNNQRDKASQLAQSILNEKVKCYGFDTYEMHQHLRKLFREFE